MDAFDFSRLGVFIVEDNNYVRETLEGLLRHFRFGRIAVASNGEEAIDYMKTLGSASSIIAPDIVLSDLVMTPINGLLFLRWMRTAKESSNRMIPYILLSGAADGAYVNSARDLGVTEFLAKPFSAASVYRHLVKVIEAPRQFVTTTKYFGPDRRRQKQDPPGKERRLKDEEDVTIVYSAEKVVKPKQPTDVWYFRLPTSLKEKAGGGGLFGGAPKQRQFQRERAGADAATAQAGMDQIGKAELLEKATAVFDHQKTGRIHGLAEKAGLDLPQGQRGVEKREIGRVVEMAVLIVVGPAGGQGGVPGVCAARAGHPRLSRRKAEEAPQPAAMAIASDSKP